MVHSIAYDLKAPNDTWQDYTRVIDHIKATFPTWAHVEKSVWLVSTSWTTSQVRDSMKKVLNSTDQLLVAQMSDWASYNITSEITGWLNKQPL